MFRTRSSPTTTAARPSRWPPRRAPSASANGSLIARPPSTWYLSFRSRLTPPSLRIVTKLFFFATLETLEKHILTSRIVNGVNVAHCKRSCFVFLVRVGWDFESGWHHMLALRRGFGNFHVSSAGSCTLRHRSWSCIVSREAQV